MYSETRESNLVYNVCLCNLISSYLIRSNTTMKCYLFLSISIHSYPFLSIPIQSYPILSNLFPSIPFHPSSPPDCAPDIVGDRVDGASIQTVVGDMAQRRIVTLRPLCLFQFVNRPEATAALHPTMKINYPTV